MQNAMDGSLSCTLIPLLTGTIGEAGVIKDGWRVGVGDIDIGLMVGVRF